MDKWGFLGDSRFVMRKTEDKGGEGSRKNYFVIQMRRVKDY